jgi:hypothetical protein
MGKASELYDELANRPLTPQEREARNPSPPPLKLKADVIIEVDSSTTVESLLGHLATEGVRSIEVRLADGSNRTGVLVPVDRYVTLVGAKLKSDRNFQFLDDGRVVPQEFDAADVEHVHPDTASWHFG